MMRMIHACIARARRFPAREGGAISVMNLFVIVIVAIFGGLAVDMAHLIQSKTQLQIAADTAAHAAIVTRDLGTAQEAREKALEIAYTNMPAARYGSILTAENIHFGTYDSATRTFTVDETSDEAVYVETTRLGNAANAVSVFLLQFIGYGQFDVVTTAVYSRDGRCMNDGWLSRTRVDAQSNNSFQEEFCLYSDYGVEVNNGNTFDPDTAIVTPTGIDGVTYPANGFAQNPGLENAIKEPGMMTLAILDKFDVIEANLTNGGTRFKRDYLPANATWQTIPAKKNMTPADFPAGGMYQVTGCPGNKINFNGTFSEVAIKVDCKIQFSNGSALEDVVLINMDTSADSISASHVRLGRQNKPCSADGGAQLLLQGGFRAASGLQIYGSQILAQGDVNFAAQANGVKGASIVAKGEIDGTSLTDMSTCANIEPFHFFFPEYRLRA